jgi:putative heme-binding domain-containing protein
LLYQPPLEKLFLVGTKPSQGSFGIPGAENIAAGDPYRSVLYYRMAKLGRGRMPYSGSNLVDPKGLDLIHTWITKLPAAPASMDDRHKLFMTLIASTTKESERKEILHRLLASPDAALYLLRSMDTHKIADSIRASILTESLAHPDGQVRDLFERFTPEEQRVKRLGSVIKPESILALRGDTTRGRRLFFQAQGVQCKSCHQIDKEGGDVGPDLSAIGKKYNRTQLLESLLEPSKLIDASYVTHLVETSRGMTYAGLLVKKTDAEVFLKDAQGKLVAVPMKDVESLSPSRVSMMPELLLRDLTAQEVADLLEYLGSRK